MCTIIVDLSDCDLVVLSFFIYIKVLVTKQMAGPRLLLLSNSKQHGGDYFEWCAEYVKSFFTQNNVSEVLFIPYAIRDYDGYKNKVSGPLEKLGLHIESIHEKKDPVEAVNQSKGIFVGGGNTFLLLKTLYEKQLIRPIRQSVLTRGVPYMGSSAGTNVATRSINTTNDMPICYPPSFEALKLVPFNINPHYIDADLNSKHMGETREERIKEFLGEPECAPVLGLREGSCLLVESEKATLLGINSAILFEK
ncbi:alpha-aspartyl dipeptidase-like [Stegodyphus dumicola]|uniref:alpha-aspartyl dipeptidase-like n=1 Tax=Stegodyphus dumicola TaxID=202533 RepID=UPI0015B00532|nr:alpha-aspartyl dipeptidase-like [Stegodyphus dumicola]